jgi:hypothetical protein
MESKVMSDYMNRLALLMSIVIYTLAVPPLTPVSAQDGSTDPDSAMALKGGEEGTVFKSLTIEGEDRVRIEFERPPLVINLDPTQAPGLDWDDTWDVLGRCDIDYVSPLIAISANGRSPFLPRPWFDEFVTGDVVRFRPALKDVDKWKMTIADSRSQTVAVFEGSGKPPEELGWDGRDLEGNPMPPGLTYSYVLEAYDRAGNKRNFVGEGFSLPSYQIESKEQLVLVFSGSKIRSISSRQSKKRDLPPAIILDVATRLNQFVPNRKIRIETTARTYNDANVLAETVATALEPLLLGNPSLIQKISKVQAEAPAEGTVAIVVSH